MNGREPSVPSHRDESGPVQDGVTIDAAIPSLQPPNEDGVLMSPGLARLPTSKRLRRSTIEVNWGPGSRAGSGQMVR